jgi:hypothetical protein
MLRWQQAALVLALLACPVLCLAIDEWESEDGDCTLELIGSERLFGAFLHYPDIPSLYPEGDDAVVASVTRLMLEGDLGEITAFEVNAFLDLSRIPETAVGGAFSTAGSFETPYRTTYLTADIWHNGALDGEVGLDRLVFEFDLDPVTLSVGRMPVNYSVTSMFTPNDFFAPFSAVAINTMYKPGVDALRLSLSTGMLSAVELLGVLGSGDDDAPEWGESAVLVHAKTVAEEVELALLGGKLAERWVAGASVQAPAGPLNLRAEGHAGFPDTDGDLDMDDVDGDSRVEDGIHARLATGVDAMFAWRNASLGFEYQYLSDGARSTSRYTERALRYFPDDPFYLARHYLGLNMGGEIIPILRTMAAVLLNAEDGSGIFTWTLVYNIADEADFIGGVMVPWGESPRFEDGSEIPLFRSELGQSPFNLFLESRFYF